MTLQEILATLDATDQQLTQGNIGAAKMSIAKLKSALGGAQQTTNVIKEDGICPSCEKKLTGKRGESWCQHCGWREN